VICRPLRYSPRRVNDAGQRAGSSIRTHASVLDYREADREHNGNTGRRHRR
jgi:hypothetical protein